MANAREVLAVLFKATAVLHQDSLGGTCKNLEAYALKDLPVLGLGEHLEIQDALCGGIGDNAGEKRQHKAFRTGGRGYGNALDDIGLDPGAGKDCAVRGRAGIVMVKLFHAEAAFPEEGFHLIMEERNAERQFLYETTVLHLSPEAFNQFISKGFLHLDVLQDGGDEGI